MLSAGNNVPSLSESLAVCTFTRTIPIFCSKESLAAKFERVDQDLRSNICNNLPVVFFFFKMLILQMVLISRAKNDCKRITLVIRSPEKLIQLILLLVLITLSFVSIQQWEALYHPLVWKKTQAANVKKIYILPVAAA